MKNRIFISMSILSIMFATIIYQNNFSSTVLWQDSDSTYGMINSKPSTYPRRTADERRVNPSVPYQAPVKESTLEKISNLSRILANTETKISALRILLADPELQSQIVASLHDPESYEEPHFNRKLRLLDALYEGIKFPDDQISNEYIHLADSVLNEEPPISYLEKYELRRQFLADRVEIALALLKRFPRIAREIQDHATESGTQAFTQASKLLNIYEIAL